LRKNSPLPLNTCPTLDYLFFWLKQKSRFRKSYLGILSEKKNKILVVLLQTDTGENNETLQMRRRLIKTKHSIFGQGNSKRGHIRSLHPFMPFVFPTIQPPFVSLFLYLPKLYLSIFYLAILVSLFHLPNTGLNLNFYCSMYLSFAFTTSVSIVFISMPRSFRTPISRSSPSLILISCLFVLPSLFLFVFLYFPLLCSFTLFMHRFFVLGLFSFFSLALPLTLYLIHSLYLIYCTICSIY